MKYQFENEQITGCIKCPLCRLDEGESPLSPYYYVCNHEDKILITTHNPIDTIDKPNWCPLVQVQDE